LAFARKPHTWPVPLSGIANPSKMWRMRRKLRTEKEELFVLVLDAPSKLLAATEFASELHTVVPCIAFRM
jgi:hypothetical protein